MTEVPALNMQKQETELGNLENELEVLKVKVDRLKRLGVKRPLNDLFGDENRSENREMNSEDCLEISQAEWEPWLEEVSHFVKSYDFMRLGQAINRGQWQSAAMTIRRMDMQAKKLGLDCFARPFTGLKQMVGRKNAPEAKQILATVIAKRVKILEVFNK